MVAFPVRVETRAIDDLRPYPGNARRHPRKQLQQLAMSMKQFGFTAPVLATDDDMIVAGHGRVEAAKLAGMAEVPVIRLSHLTPEQARAYILADNRLAELGEWDGSQLAVELQGVIELGFDAEMIGFDTVDVDRILGSAVRGDPAASVDQDDVIPELSKVAITGPGDIWHLGRHRLICGDALDLQVTERVMAGEVAGLLMTDPPYNVPIDGHVSGLGKRRHREFAFASGEMSRSEFTTFLATALACASAVMRDGAIGYVFMDWRHAMEIQQAGEIIFGELKQLCVWNKTNGGMGSFYRSKHELVFVWKKGTAPHINNFGLGDKGRYRTNVWDYPGISSRTATRDAELAMHPTVKPVRMIQDAIEDCSKRGDIVLDSFGGSGTTLIAAERSGRRARLVEYDPLYCDTIIRRYRALTGRPVTLGVGGPTFEDVGADRHLPGRER